ncbi:MAG: flagellar M-ring protein FliF, partial [Peptococcaceae bacterium]|nr:flagellar M-ring protein FliF [Peptococcaceae bacterium]
DSISEQQLENIEAVVATATGIDLDRGDLIQVARLPFNKNSILEHQAALEELARQERFMLYVQLAAGLLAALLLLIIILRLRSKKNKELEQLTLEQEEKLVTLEEAEKLLAAQMEAERQAELKLARRKVKTTEEIEREKTRKEVDKYSRENPDEVARLVRAWLAEEQ